MALYASANLINALPPRTGTTSQSSYIRLTAGRKDFKVFCDAFSTLSLHGPQLLTLEVLMLHTWGVDANSTTLDSHWQHKPANGDIVILVVFILVYFSWLLYLVFVYDLVSTLIVVGFFILT